MRGLFRISFAVMLVIALAAGTACAPKAQETKLTPTITPPAIKTAGTLVAGVDLEHPPYAGKDDGQEAGLDVDVAAAVAAKLGLTLKTVQVAPSEAATALADGTCDIVLSLPLDESSVLGATLAGTYASSGPTFFVMPESPAGSAEASASGESSSAPVADLTVSSVARMKVGAQQASASFWLLDYQLGEGAVRSYPTLRDAFKALAAGEVDVVAADALTGAYIARDFPGAVFAGQATQATLLGVGVSPENTELATAVREALDTLAADGVLDQIRATWVGDLPELDTIVSGAGASGEATEAP